MQEIKDYLGDGVYAIFDGHDIMLHANDLNNPTDKICLEPQVFDALVRFEKRCWEEVNKAAEPELGNNGEPIKHYPEDDPTEVR